MKKFWLFNFTISFTLFLSACGTPLPALTPTPVSTSTSTSTSTPITTPTPVSIPTSIPTNTPIAVSAVHPCIGGPAPAQWHHVVVLMFENKTYDQVIGPAPYITSLANNCATSSSWKDANFKVDGSSNGKYTSKPNYATLTNGLSPSAHGLVDDTYKTTTNVDNIYNQLNLSGLTFKDYYEAEAGGCGVRFSGDYHDAIRYYNNVAAICDAHDVPLSTFMTDLNNGNLPAFSVLLPTNGHNMHSSSIRTGDAFAQTILDPLLNSPMYAKGDLAIFFLWDENTPIPNVLLAPSVVPGTKITAPAGNPISHFSALRTWEEMLDLPLLGDTKLAPSLLPFFEGLAPSQ